MISNVSGPIPTHEIYFSQPSTINDKTATNRRKLMQSYDKLNILQWQTNTSSVRSSRPGTASENSKNYVRDNIRRIREYQRLGAMKHAFDSTTPPRTQLTPRPVTAGPTYSLGMEKKFGRMDTGNSAGTGLGDQGTLNGSDPPTEWSAYSRSSDPKLETPCALASSFNDKPCALVECRSTQYSLPEVDTKVSQGVQVTSTELAGPVSTSLPEEQTKGKPQSASTGSRSRPNSAVSTKHEFLRAHQKTACNDLNLQTLGTIPIRKPSWTPRPEQLTVPAASSAKTVQFIRRNINYIRANAHLASTTAKSTGKCEHTINRRSTVKCSQAQPWYPAAHGGELNLIPERKLPVGGLPPYILKRRQEAAVAAAEEAANQPDPDQPPGHQRMPEKDRVATLELLQKAHAELTKEWSQLPVRMDTMRIRNRRSELEHRLHELEQAITIFEKPKVFIKPT